MEGHILSLPREAGGMKYLGPDWRPIHGPAGLLLFTDLTLYEVPFCHRRRHLLTG